ncbi:VOC family protein [Allopontixanthobacter sediminis]|uniref:VOC family protein n=1 Tax=Allopontixanthobacter sediminis TaxID=1689985 RepID=A0A845B493_9SPHN|nr:VOC family protein [Allopontixanthobacter sediminis]MXP45485.1 VOC family protein [Allopontixanthobacter sediminis]
MSVAKLEHVNLTVTDPARLAALLTDLCGWHIRWQGPAMNNGHTIHIGSDTGYLALYSSDRASGSYAKGQPLNHVGLQVDDLDAAEQTVIQAGLEPFSHSAYDPGPNSFYFFDWDGIEFEVVSYA